jgi:hypothetical protein
MKEMFTKKNDFSLSNKDNYKISINATSYEIIQKYLLIIVEYLLYLIDYNSNIGSSNLTEYLTNRGIETITPVFLHLLHYTKNPELAYYHSEKSFYFYVEFISQVSREDKSFLQLTSRDACNYVFKKTIYNIDNRYVHSPNMHISQPKQYANTEDNTEQKQYSNMEDNTEQQQYANTDVNSVIIAEPKNQTNKSNDTTNDDIQSTDKQLGDPILYDTQFVESYINDHDSKIKFINKNVYLYKSIFYKITSMNIQTKSDFNNIINQFYKLIDLLNNNDYTVDELTHVGNIIRNISSNLNGNLFFQTSIDLFKQLQKNSMSVQSVEKNIMSIDVNVYNDFNETKIPNLILQLTK